MIIDEGFLSNAKKIAATQPQNTEVKAPVIRRENWEYNIKIIFTGIKVNENKQFITRIISSCVMFKEHSDISFNQDGNSIYVSFGSDLFITSDTVFELVYKITKPDNAEERIEITSNESDKKYKITDSVLYKFKKIRNIDFSFSIIPFEKLIIIKNMFEQMGITGNSVSRWILHRGICMTSSPVDNTVYPVYFDYTKTLYEIISSYHAENISIITNNIKWDFPDEKYEGIKELITKSDIRKFIMYYNGIKPDEICIQPETPILFNKKYTYPIFMFLIGENPSTKSEYEYMKGIIEEAEPYKKKTEIGYQDGIQYAHVTEEYKPKNKNGTDNSKNIYIEANYTKEPDKNELTNEISSSDFITELKDIRSTLKNPEDIFDFYSFSASITAIISNKPQDAYDFFSIFKNAKSIYIRNINRKSSKLERDLFFPEKDTIYERTSKTLCINRLMRTLGIPDKEIIEWFIENKIAAVIPSDNNSISDMHPVYLNSAIEIMNHEMSISMTDAFTAEKIKHQDTEISRRILTESLNIQDIHKFIFRRYSADGKKYIEITTLYPVLYKDTYVYPTFTMELNGDKFSISMENILFVVVLNWAENNKRTSDLIFVDRNGDNGATGADDTK